MVQELAVWKCHIQVAKFWGDWEPEKDPYTVDEYDGNMLMNGGVSLLWEGLEGSLGAAGSATGPFSAGNAAIGVGDSTTASTAIMTNLQAATNRLRVVCDSGFPEHADGTAAANATVRFRSTFGTAQANFAWQEAGVFNSATDGAGRMLNRRVQAMGTKTSASSWQITFDITITGSAP